MTAGFGASDRRRGRASRSGRDHHLADAATVPIDDRDRYLGRACRMERRSDANVTHVAIAPRGARTRSQIGPRRLSGTARYRLNMGHGHPFHRPTIAFAAAS